jgi:HEAT repeat protein
VTESPAKDSKNVSNHPGATLGEAAQRRRNAIIAGYRDDAEVARSSLSDPAAQVREAAIGALERCESLTETELLNALSDESPEVRRRGALAASRRVDAAAQLLALLGDPDDSVVEVAAFAWGERPDGSLAVLALSTVAIEHTDSLCREAAVAALGAIGDPGGLSAVLHGCEDRASVRRRAILALAAFEGPEATAALEAGCNDRDIQVRQAAEDLLAIERSED